MSTFTIDFGLKEVRCLLEDGTFSSLEVGDVGSTPHCGEVLNPPPLRFAACSSRYYMSLNDRFKIASSTRCRASLDVPVFFVFIEPT
jgi:hypothetical protein